MEQDKNQNNKNQEQDKSQHKKRKVSALEAASLGRSATEQVNPHSNSGLANTGTNISYEGATAPGAGGSVGSGYASGKEAADEKISTNSDYTQNRAEHVSSKNQEKEMEDEELDEEGFEEDDFDDDVEQNEMR